MENRDSIQYVMIWWLLCYSINRCLKLLSIKMAQCLGVMQKWCWRVLTIGSICLIYGIVERVNQLTNNVKFLIIIYHPDFRSYFYRRLLKLLALWFSYSFLLIKCTMQCKILKDMVDIDFKTSFPLNSRHFWDPPDNTKIYNPVPVYDLIAISK